MRSLFLALALILALAPLALASETSSDPANLIHRENAFVGEAFRSNVLLIETIDSVVNTALVELGITFDMFAGEDFSAVDLSAYDHVFVAMDGGQIEAPSIMNVAAWASAGGCLHFYGGSNHTPYAQALNDYLLQNDTANHSWTTSATPHVTVVDAGHYLATDLPGSYDFLESSASFYQTRSTDGGMAVAAINGDQFDMLMSRGIGDGNFDICINSASSAYYLDDSDYRWARQVVDNMLGCDGAVATEASNWGAVKSLFD